MSALLLTLALLVAPTQGVDAILARPALQAASVSLAVVDAESGERLISRAIDDPAAPASNLKLLTTAAAITRLGPGWRFTTRLLAGAEPDARGVVRGDLVVWGSGDPCLRADALQPEGIDDPAAILAGQLADRGITRIDGALVLDDGFLDRQWVHPDWDESDLVEDYAAPVSALSIHDNCLRVAVSGALGGPKPGARLLTVTSRYRVEDQLEWASDDSTCLVSLLRPDDAGLVRVRGRVSPGVPERAYPVPVRDPALYFGRCLQARLAERGISVRGGLERDAGAARALGDAVELGGLDTPLDLAVVLANKESDNSICDHLVKVLGAVLEGEGSFEAGTRAVEQFLAEYVETPTEHLVLRDGSGLARTNRVTARAVGDTLLAMNRSEPRLRDLFLRTLPVAGMDGTLRDRLDEDPYRGRVRAKTGYIRGVSALSGYLQARSGRVLVFSILINDVPAASSNRDMKALQDDLCRALVDLF